MDAKADSYAASNLQRAVEQLAEFLASSERASDQQRVEFGTSLAYRSLALAALAMDPKLDYDDAIEAMKDRSLLSRVDGCIDSLHDDLVARKS